jgi:NitT/TauT family transport system substrate-binding protein
MSSTRMVFRSVAVSWLAAVVAVAGCGGEEEKGGAGAETVKVQETAGVPSAFVGFGIEKGVFERHRLKVELEASQGGAATIPALVSGDIQVGGSNVVSSLLARGKGLPVRLIAPGTSAHDEGEKDFGALVVTRDGPIRSLRDLEGETVAVNTLNNIADLVVKASLDKQGVDPASVKLIELPFPEMGAALEKGQAAAAFTIEPFLTQLQREGAKAIDYSYVETRPKLQVGAYAVTEQYAAENPEIVKRYSEAIAENADYVMSHPDEFRDFLSQKAKIEPRLAKSMVLPRFTERIDAESLDATAQLMRRYGLLKEPVSTAQLLEGGK